MELDGKVAIVTGGTRGIGRAIAEIFLQHGSQVVINGRSKEKGAQAIAEINRGNQVVFIQGDVSKKEDCESLVDQAVSQYGALHILVNNAGGCPGFGLVGEMSDEAWLDTLDLNLNSAFFMTRRALKYLAPQRWGRIIHISSVEGKQATKAAVSNYITTKHALNGFSKAVAYEYATQGITSNAICPGAIETDVMMEQGPKSAAASGMSYEQFKQNYADDAMIKRLNTVDEVAAMALLLASEVGGGITGATLAVDGGSSDY